MLQTSDILHLQFGTGKKVGVSGKSIVLEDYWELRGEICAREKYKHALKAPQRVFATNQ